MEPLGELPYNTARLTQLLSDERLHDAIAAEARQTAVSRFCTELVIPIYERYYGQVCTGGNSTKATGV